MIATEVKYKKTGIEWMPEVPEHWEIIRLKNIVQINANKLSEQTSKNSQIKYIDITNVNGDGEILEVQHLKFKDAPSRARRVLKKNDTIISTVRTYLKAISAIRDDNFIGSTGFAVLTPNVDRLNPDFLYYSVSSKAFVNKVMVNSVGVAYPAITPTTLACLPFILPPIEEQNRIVKILNSESAKITHFIQTKQRFIELLKEQRQSIITNAVTKGIVDGVKMKHSGFYWIGDVPEQWEIRAVKTLLKAVKGSIKAGPFGSDLKGTDIIERGIKIYNQRTVLDSDFTQGEEFISKTKFEELSVFEVGKGDVLITTRGTIGKATVVPDDFEKGIIHPCLIRLRFNEEVVTNDFITTIFNEAKYFSDLIKMESNSNTIDVIYADTLKFMKLLIPPIEDQKRIVDHIKTETRTLDIAISKAEREIELIKEYREAMIAEAVTGKMEL